MLLSSHLIGEITLNISTIIYLIYYLPQLIHNIKSSNLREMSFYFHFILLTAALSDLVYGFGMHMPWQYRLVSFTWVAYLLVQQFQLWRIHKKSRKFQFLSCSLLAYTIAGFLLYLSGSKMLTVFVVFGYISVFFGIIHTVPQIVRNFNLSSAHALSVYYLILVLVTRVCDNVSAWMLHWPLPSKIGPVIGFICTIVLLSQWLYYKYLSNGFDGKQLYSQV